MIRYCFAIMLYLGLMALFSACGRPANSARSGICSPEGYASAVASVYAAQLDECTIFVDACVEHPDSASPNEVWLERDACVSRCPGYIEAKY